MGCPSGWETAGEKGNTKAEPPQGRGRRGIYWGVSKGALKDLREAPYWDG